MTTVAVPADVTWAGRLAGGVCDGLDDWNCDRTSLFRMLDRAQSLVVLDALSFPWESLRAEDREVPVGLVLPPELDGPGIEHVLGRVALRHLCPHDRILEARSEVRRHLGASWGWPDRMWVTPSPQAGAEDQATLLRRSLMGDPEVKGRWRQRLHELARQVRHAIDEHPHWSRTLVVSDDPDLAPQLEGQVDAPVALASWDQAISADLPVEAYGTVVLADVETVAAKSLEDALRRAVRATRVTGHLVVHGIVVADPDAPSGTPSPPSVSRLLTSLEAASGQGLQLEDVRALRLGREPLRRAAVLSFARLGTSGAP